MSDPDWESFVDILGDLLEDLFETRTGQAVVVLIILAAGAYLLWA